MRTLRALIPLAALLAPGLAAAGTPLATATLAEDGTYTLVLQPERAWTEAEVTVADDGAQDLGPAAEDEPVRLEGRIESRGPLRVTVNAATADSVGYTWRFEVVPDLVPVEMPSVEADLEPARSRRKWPFGRR
jgi:hypothetical protein